MKEKTKKILITSLITALFSLYLLPVVVSAQEPPTPIKNTGDIIRVLNNVRNVIWAILGVIVVIMFIWAGVTFVTAEGDPGKVEKARNRILYGVIGIIIGLLAGGILLLVQSVMT
jgi:hypothetical protein